MSQEVYAPPEVIPDIEAIDIEGEKVVESVVPEKLSRLLAESLAINWPGPGEGRTFQVFTGVGLFFDPRRPGLCPDLMLALDIGAGTDDDRADRSYFNWLRGKVPDLVLEVVSEREAGEDGHKLREYQRISVPYYVIFDPLASLSDTILRSYELRGGRYHLLPQHQYEAIGLGLRVIDGIYEGRESTWLQWCNANGDLIPTGAQRVASEVQRANAEAARADAESQRADRERARADALEARLRALGETP